MRAWLACYLFACIESSTVDLTSRRLQQWSLLPNSIFKWSSRRLRRLERVLLRPRVPHLLITIVVKRSGGELLVCAISALRINSVIFLTNSSIYNIYCLLSVLFIDFNIFIFYGYAKREVLQKKNYNKNITLYTYKNSYTRIKKCLEKSCFSL